MPGRDEHGKTSLVSPGGIAAELAFFTLFIIPTFSEGPPVWLVVALLIVPDRHEDDNVSLVSVCLGQRR